MVVLAASAVETEDARDMMSGVEGRDCAAAVTTGGMEHRDGDFLVTLITNRYEGCDIGSRWNSKLLQIMATVNKLVLILFYAQLQLAWTAAC